jgi:type IV pilus assembly protein PilE
VLGFSLPELMIVVVVIAVLAAIAMPAYTEYVRRARRAEAIQLINTLSQQQERHRANNSGYAATLATLYPSASAPAPTSAYYVMSVSSANDSGYAITATTAGAQLGDTKCSSLTLWMQGGNPGYNSTGSATSNQCWNR